VRKKLIVALVLLNGIFAGAFLAVPADSQIIPMGLWGCCKSDSPGDSYCCRACCWFISNCVLDSDCRAPTTMVKAP